MNIADVVLVLLLLGAAASGYRQGLVTALLTLVGAIGGALIGIRVAPVVAQSVTQPTAQVAIGIALVIVGVGIGETIGQHLGRAVTRHIRWQPAMAVDRGLGLVGHAIAVLVVAWLIAVPLAVVPLPWLSSQIRSSAVLSAVDGAMPSQAEAVSSRLRNLFVGKDFPQILAPLAPAPDTPVDAPDPSLADGAAAVADHASILKVRARAPKCSQAMEGSGFVAAPGMVVTNAHVVAGASSVEVETADGPLPAQVVAFDPDVDIAVLRVESLAAPPLKFSADDAGHGDSAIAAGYPLDGPFTLSPMRVRSRILLEGPNIYSSGTVQREVYTLRGSVRPGNSGGPLLAPDGTVLGVVFGAAIDNPDVGFALTDAEVRPTIVAGATAHGSVGTGACMAE